MAIRTILAAVAPGGDGEAVVRRAMQLAAAHEARLLLLRVIEELEEGPPRPFPGDSGAIDRLLRIDALEGLRQLAAGADAELLLEVGRASAAIARVAASRGADLLLIGPGRPRNLGERLLGSTADRLLRVAPCPLLLVRDAGAAPYRRVVCGVDFSAPSMLAASLAAGVAPEALLTLLHVVELPLSFEQAMRRSGVAEEEIDRYRRDRLLQERRRLRRDYGGRFPPPALLRVVPGDAATVLVRASRARQSTLLAVGASGAGAVAGRLLGSVARKVLLRARSDVLLIPG